MGLGGGGGGGGREGIINIFGVVVGWDGWLGSGHRLGRGEG